MYIWPGFITVNTRCYVADSVRGGVSGDLLRIKRTIVVVRTYTKEVPNSIAKTMKAKKVLKVM